MNIYDYIKKYGNYSFKEKTFCEIDNLVFSLLVYLDFSEFLVDFGTINEVGIPFLNRYSYRDMNKYVPASRDAYKCLKSIVNTKRYKDIVMSDYVYIGNTMMQFSAITFKISKKLIYISFEGTDSLLSGWKENFYLAYQYPTISQKYALKYLRKKVRLFGPRVIVGGHSKGGNLALTSCMELLPHDKFKINTIYNNDGPGLKLKQIKSLKYKMIRKKLVHITPYNSVVGILLRNEFYKSVDATFIPVASHSISTWKINNDELVLKERDYNSIKLEKNIISWLDNHNDLEREKMITTVFNLLSECGINDTSQFTDISKIVNIFKHVKEIDNETRNLVIDFINTSFFKK